jgi:hypothetical protein
VDPDGHGFIYPSHQANLLVLRTTSKSLVTVGLRGTDILPFKAPQSRGPTITNNWGGRREVGEVQYCRVPISIRTIVRVDNCIDPTTIHTETSKRSDWLIAQSMCELTVWHLTV